MSLLFENWRLGEFTYLLLRFNKTKFYHETQGILVDMVQIHTTHSTHSE